MVCWASCKFTSNLLKVLTILYLSYILFLMLCVCIFVRWWRVSIRYELNLRYLYVNMVDIWECLNSIGFLMFCFSVFLRWYYISIRYGLNLKYLYWNISTYTRVNMYIIGWFKFSCLCKTGEFHMFLDHVWHVEALQFTHVY